MLHDVVKETSKSEEAVVSGGKKEIDEEMQNIKCRFKNVFTDKLGRATKVEPVHINVDENIKPVPTKA